MNPKLSLLSAGLLGIACATTPSPDLEAARGAYQDVADGPAVALAPDEVTEAGHLLGSAEQSYRVQGNSPETRDWAYVGQRKAEIAASHARSTQYTLIAVEGRKAADTLRGIYDELKTIDQKTSTPDGRKREDIVTASREADGARVAGTKRQQHDNRQSGPDKP